MGGQNKEGPVGYSYIQVNPLNDFLFELRETITPDRFEELLTLVSNDQMPPSVRAELRPKTTWSEEKQCDFTSKQVWYLTCVHMCPQDNN